MSRYFNSTILRFLITREISFTSCLYLLVWWKVWFLVEGSLALLILFVYSRVFALLILNVLLVSSKIWRYKIEDINILLFLV